ncbi:MAG: endopeptidase La [Deltaproteobacteria bacterium]|nr:endopeptidase La [Deltaproteobacteria bacterium]
MSESETTPDGAGEPSDELVGEVVEDDGDGKKPEVSSEDTGLLSISGEMPANVIVVPVDETILFPGMTIPVVYPPGPTRDAVEFAAGQGPFVAFVPRKTPRESGSEATREALFNPDDLMGVGVLARILKSLHMPGGNRSFFIAVSSRVVVQRYLRIQPYLIARVTYPPDQAQETKEFKALWRAAKGSLADLLKEIPGLPEGFSIAAANLEGPAQLTDFVAAHLDLKREERVELLATVDLDQRLRKVLEALNRELELARLAGRIREEIRQKIEKSQREYYLREQIKAIRKELGEEVDQKQLALQELEKRITERGLPEEPAKRAREELKRLEVLSPESPEYNVVRSYLEWMTELPWAAETADVTDLRKAKAVLEADHYGLDEVKERIIEFLAVRKLKPDTKGAILCFSGPPGVGKTSLGQSIARALGRKFFRFSLGGMRDEAEIKGHRRTYIGAMPGKILQGLRTVAVRNPVFMLDEIDKLGQDWRGDPSSAMLEVLDPAQNVNFLDHYVDVPFDLSRVMFICTANIKTQIPPPLLDRMEIIDLPGYILEEKVEIAKRYLYPRQREAHGLRKDQLVLKPTVYPRIIDGWTREAGVRDLERRIGRVARKVAARVASDRIKTATVGPDKLETYLGPRQFYADELHRTLRPGVVVGLAWTPVGGEIMFIEATRMPGKGGFKVTGQLGEVMSESAQIALSYVRAHLDRFEIDPDVFDKSDLHIHFPAGATPKDGPSAGIAITTSIVSLLGWNKGRKIRPRLAMTGEMTLRGEVLPIGGVREKCLAARRAGVRTVILPAENKRNVAEIPKHILKGLAFQYAATYDDVRKLAF